MATVAGKVLEKNFATRIELSECSYLALYFELIMREKEDQIVQTKMKKIAVVCTTGRGTANMICRRLAKVLGPDIVISQFSEEQFNPEKDDNYFAIFTTVPLKFGQLKSPLVQITNLFNDQWLQNEWQKVQHIHQRRQKSNIVRFIRMEEESTYETYLIKMATALVDEGLVDLAFPERILQREEKQSTLFGNQIAFPHTLNLLDQNPVLMVGILEKLFVAGSQEVALIFMVAIPKSVEEDTETELLEVYDDIFRIASDKCLWNELQLLKSQEEFNQFIAEKGVF